MKINVELDDEEVEMLTDAFGSAIAEVYFINFDEDLDEEEKNEYFIRVQKLIDKIGLSLKVDDVIDELIELNESNDDEVDDEIEIDEDKK